MAESLVSSEKEWVFISLKALGEKVQRTESINACKNYVLCLFFSLS